MAPHTFLVFDGIRYAVIVRLNATIISTLKIY